MSAAVRMVNVPWTSTPIPVSSLSQSIRHSAREISRLKGKTPLFEREERALLAIVKLAGQQGILIELKDFSIASGRRIAAVIDAQAVKGAIASEAELSAGVATLFFKLRWNKLREKEFFPPIISFGGSKPQPPSNRFLKIFGLQSFKPNFSASIKILGAYEQDLFGRSLTRVGTALIRPDSRAVADLLRLIEKSEPNIFSALQKPSRSAFEQFAMEFLVDLEKANNAADAVAASFGAVGDAASEIEDVFLGREKAVKAFAAELSRDLQGRRFTVNTAIERLYFVGVQTLGRDRRVIMSARNGFMTSARDTLEQFDENMRSVIKDLEASLEDEGIANPAESRKRGRRRRARIWNEALQKELPKITSAAAAASVRTQREIAATLKMYGAAAEGLGRATLAVEIGLLLGSGSEWQDYVQVALKELLQDIGARILRIVGRYVGAVIGGGIGAFFGGEAGAVIGALIGYVAGAFLGGYFGHMLGGKIADAFGPILIENMDAALAQIEMQVEEKAVALEKAGADFSQRGRNASVDGEPDFFTSFERNLLEKAGARKPN